MNYTRKVKYGATHNIEHIKHRECRAGFDLTDFYSVESFKKLLERFRLSSYKRHEMPVPYNKSYKYTWSNPIVMIITGNNPISGAYSVPSARGNEKGYASCIGIEGECRIVREIFDYIDAHAISKGESPHHREFI